MGRPRKEGLDYFPFDVDMFQDIKIRKLIKYQGGKAVTVYALLLCLIYKCGYYMRWDEELPFIVSELSGFEEAYIREVINSCMVLGLFSKKLFDEERVVTSKGIQERYMDICLQSKRRCVISEYSLISSEETPVYSEETRVCSEETPVNSVKSAQSKVNKIKKNLSPRDEKKTPPAAEREGKDFFENFEGRQAAGAENGARPDTEAVIADIESRGPLADRHGLPAADFERIKAEIFAQWRFEGYSAPPAAARRYFANLVRIKAGAAAPRASAEKKAAAERERAEQKRRLDKAAKERRPSEAVTWEQYARQNGMEGKSIAEVIAAAAKDAGKTPPKNGLKKV